MVEDILDRLKRKYQEKSLKILIVGAGALANFVVIGLSSLDVGKITIVDKDEIEAHNLNRQILFFDAVGKKKSKILTERAKKLNKINRHKSITRFLDNNTQYLFGWINRPDIMIDCTDNFKTRAILNQFALKYKVPLISGGTSWDSGQVIMYIPEKTSCLNCELNIDELAKKSEEENNNNGCTQVPEASVVISNQIVGGIIVKELKNLLENKKVTKGTIKYMSSEPNKIGLIKSSHVCDCHTKKIIIPKEKIIVRIGNKIRKIYNPFKTFLGNLVLEETET